MNDKRLASHYDALTARERVSLLLAANIRGDEVEAGRLMESAPTMAYRVVHHHFLVEALYDLSLLHLARLLEATALILKADSLLVANERSPKKKPDREEFELRLLATMRKTATRIVVLQEGWQRFCAEMQIDADASLRGLPGCDIVESNMQRARRMALTEEERAALVAMPEGPRMGTFEDVYAEYLAMLEMREGGGQDR